MFPFFYYEAWTVPMGNELRTAGGAVATAGTSVAAGITFGQVDELNNAVIATAKFTADAASKTMVRHVGETAVSAIGTAGVAVAAGVTLGQVDELNEKVVTLAKHTDESFYKSAKSVETSITGMANGVPVVGHIKGAVHYAMNDKEKGDEAMKTASRTVGVIAGGIIGSLAGPVGAVSGGIAGGALMDGLTTGIESAVKKKFAPSGQIKAWHEVHKGREKADGMAIVGGVVDGVMTVIGDGVGGYSASNVFNEINAQVSANGSVNIPEGGQCVIEANSNVAVDIVDGSSQSMGDTIHVSPDMPDVSGSGPGEFLVEQNVPKITGDTSIISDVSGNQQATYFFEEGVPELSGEPSFSSEMSGTQQTVYFDLDEVFQSGESGVVSDTTGTQYAGHACDLEVDVLQSTGESSSFPEMSGESLTAEEFSGREIGGQNAASSANAANVLHQLLTPQQVLFLRLVCKRIYGKIKKLPKKIIKNELKEQLWKAFHEKIKEEKLDKVIIEFMISQLENLIKDLSGEYEQLMQMLISKLKEVHSTMG